MAAPKITTAQYELLARIVDTDGAVYEDVHCAGRFTAPLRMLAALEKKGLVAIVWEDVKRGRLNTDCVVTVTGTATAYVAARRTRAARRAA